MAVQAQHKTVGTTPVELGTMQHDDQSVLVKNTGATALVVGGSDVTAAEGYPLAAGDALALDLLGRAGDSFWAVAASGSSTVAILRTGA